MVLYGSIIVVIVKYYTVLTNFTPSAHYHLTFPAVVELVRGGVGVNTCGRCQIEYFGAYLLGHACAFAAGFMLSGRNYHTGGKGPLAVGAVN